MDKKRTKSTKIWSSRKQIPIAYSTVLQTNDKITYLVTGQQAPGWILPTRLYIEYVTKDHIAMHTILF